MPVFFKPGTNRFSNLSFVKRFTVTALLVFGFSIPALADLGCWQEMADDRNSTEVVVRTCGISSTVEYQACKDYCQYRRGGGQALCLNICDGRTSDASSDSERGGGSGDSGNDSGHRHGSGSSGRDSVSTYCTLHPEDPQCSRPGSTQCTLHPEQPGCSRPGSTYCTLNPSDPQCSQPGSTQCTLHPEQPGCSRPGSTYCTLNPSDPQCSRPGSTQCTLHPEQPGCSRPGSTHCTLNPSDPQCSQPGSTQCTLHPEQPGCSGNGGSLCRDPSDPRCRRPGNSGGSSSSTGNRNDDGDRHIGGNFCDRNPTHPQCHGGVGRGPGSDYCIANPYARGCGTN